MTKCNLPLLLLGTASFALSAAALAGSPRVSFPVSSEIEIGVGGEGQSLEFHSDCVTNCKGSHKGSDKSRGGKILKLGFRGISVSELTKDGKSKSGSAGGVKLSFIPLSVMFGEKNWGDFGRVEYGEHEKKSVGNSDEGSTHVRHFIGALVEASYNASGWLNLRGKLAQVEYDRDKGIWEWRALDAKVGVEKAWNLSGETYLNVSFHVGGGVGGVHLNDLAGLQQELKIAPIVDSAYTLNPAAMVNLGVSSSSFKVEWAGRVEKRIDMTAEENRTEYGDRKLSVDSERFVQNAEVEYAFGGHGHKHMGTRYSLFVSGKHEIDTLTLSGMFFGGDDKFESIQVLGGARARF